MRLIDADQLIKDGWHLVRSGRSNRTLGVMSIADVPTAYDLEEKLQRLEAEIESSDKYIREYDDSKEQKAWNAGMRKCLEIVKGGEQ